jgi:hypothetical protein
MMIVRFQATKLLIFNIVIIPVVLLFVLAASYLQQRPAIGQAEEGVFIRNATFTEEQQELNTPSSSADTVTNVTATSPTLTREKANQTLGLEGQLGWLTTDGNFLLKQIETVHIGNKTYPIVYNITGGEVDNMTASQQNSSLIVDLSTNNNGTLTIDLPRSIIDSKNPQNEDEDYIAFVDGIQTGAEEISNTNNQTRKLAVDFENGTQQMEIVGTRIVPELGSYSSILILSASIIGILALAAKWSKF